MLQVTVNLTIKTCGCGSLYAIPEWMNFERCPACSGRTIERLNTEKYQLEKSVSALRAVISRMKNKT